MLQDGVVFCICHDHFFLGRFGVLCVFFFKQKTAYEMRISDWSSDVCSSDLLAKAIARDGRQFLDETPTPTAHDLQSLTGRGVQARIDGEVVRIGKAEMFGRDGIADLSTEMAAAIERLREQGRTTMVVRKDRKSTRLNSSP